MRWSISVWPGATTPAARRAGLWIGPVTIPAAVPARVRWTALSTARAESDSCRMLGAVETTYALVATESRIELVRSHQDELRCRRLWLSEMPNGVPNHLRADSARITERHHQA